ncbi:MAG TPA: isoprenylcysteine carboxylmethyltransferase family protein [bacterium]|jgi:protein-S-isoprenylcysteine O-methyltransferase Ste14
MPLKLLSTLATAAMAAAVIVLYLRHALFSPSPFVIVPQIIALLLMVWARLTLGVRSFHYTADPTAGGLVISGPYRLMRHPIYAAVLLFVWTSVISHWSALHVLLGLLATAGAVFRMLSEERQLRAHYPGYDDYARHTRRVIPFIL